MFRRHSTEVERLELDFSNGGIGIVEMLFRCNILAIVGGGRNPRYPPNKVMIWDDHQSRNIGELSFRSEVKAVKLRRDRVVVVLQNKIYVYNFSDLKLVDHIETIANPKGLCALCPNPSNTVLACPGVTRGTVRIELYDLRKTTLITAHEAELSQICLNLDGTRLATASDKGTLIRIFDTQSGQITQELRRGADRAEIYSICFSPTAPLLACSSDKGTVHVFSLTAEGSGHNFASDPTTMGNVPSQSIPTHYSAGSAPRSGEDDGTENSKSSLSFMRGLLPKYFSSEWSFAQFRVPETRTICAFGTEKNTIVVVGADGSFYKAVFDANGECQNTSYSKFIQSDEDE
ncbi:Autophagy-related protein 18d [Phytophthora citrophthora]|uniref:Autophagy-related protein 18d n=1 Tax=Phytophthora citrophthora TaxID=4793 RepID=A0AAD9G2W3_9STRA|nr:Autophagy-related protein 18d [Phytophthora citrophthora]